MSAARLALRALRRSPGFALAVILTFAVGVGATTAVFSLVDATLLAPLPYPNAKRLVAIQQTRRDDIISVSYPDFADIRARTSVFASVASFTGRSFNLTETGEPERLVGQLVSANLFKTLGMSPMLGRGFFDSEDEVAAAPVIVISHDLWMRRFGGDRGIIGRQVSMDGRTTTIVGVMSEGFHFPDGLVFGKADVWAPMAQLDSTDRQSRDSHPGLVAIGVLRPGHTLAQARTELAGIAAHLAAEYPASNKEIGIRADDAVSVIVGSLRESLLLLFAAIGLVLFIACGNVAALVLARADSRRRDMAVKTALGASSWQAVATLVREGAFLAVLGGVAGLALAWLLVHAFGPALAAFPRLSALSLDWREAAFAMLIALVAGGAASVIPAVWVGRADLDRWLRTRGGDGGRSVSTAQNVLVAAEIALSVVLLVVSSLLLRSFDRMRAETGGIDPRGVLTFSVSLPARTYAGNDARAAFFRQLHERVRALPGVTRVGAITVLPFSGSGAQSGIGAVGSGPEGATRTDVAAITPGYLGAIGMTLVRGRDFTEGDDRTAPPVALVDERFAAALWPGENAIGKHVEGWGFRDLTIVGVTRHVANYGVNADSRQELFVPFAQRTTSRLIVAVRTAGNPANLASSVRRVVTALDPTLPIFGVRTMEDVVGATVSGPRLSAFLSSAYTAIAIALVVVGIYGVLGYLVMRRTRELGIRIALGARGTNIVTLIMRRTLLLAGAGIVTGIALALVASWLIRASLYGVVATDPLTFAGAALGILVVSLLASAGPALRAARVSPLVSLSSD